ncbi:MAG TPA: helix-turn-helix domain-containing protein [Pseudonocardiaceae bacterium]|jgi:AcrR family transcriptional regulator|nr:helix-turn-helix domain-containing protein [Pseudonocardiaceae bacterium]
MGQPTRLRADAARNRELILTAARAAFRERGIAAPLDDIARMAGVNIATLYRRFPDRGELIKQVVLDAYTLVCNETRLARANLSDPVKAIESLLLRLVDRRDQLVLPLLGGPAIDDPAAFTLQREIAANLETVLTAGRANGSVREDLTAVDIITASALVCRPMPHLSTEDAGALAARHVHVFVDGLHPGQARRMPAAPTHSEFTAQFNRPS